MVASRKIVQNSFICTEFEQEFGSSGEITKPEKSDVVNSRIDNNSFQLNKTFLLRRFLMVASRKIVQNSFICTEFEQEFGSSGEITKPEKSDVVNSQLDNNSFQLDKTFLLRHFLMQVHSRFEAV